MAATTEAAEIQAARDQKEASQSEPNAVEEKRRRGVLERWRSGEIEPARLKNYNLPYWSVQAAALGIDQGADVSRASIVLVDFLTLKSRQVAAGLDRAKVQLAGLEKSHRTKLALRAIEDFEADLDEWDLADDELDAAAAEVERWQEMGGIVKEATTLATGVLCEALGAPSFEAKIIKGYVKTVGYMPSPTTPHEKAREGLRDAASSVPILYNLYLVHLKASKVPVSKQDEKELRRQFDAAAEALRDGQPAPPMPTYKSVRAVIDGPKIEAAEQAAEDAERKAAEKAQAHLDARAAAVGRNPKPRVETSEGDDE
jgi:hypothetical protein